MKDKTIEVASYAGSVTSVAAGLTLTDIGVIVGIVTALLTCAVNYLHRKRKMRYEKDEHNMRMAILKAEHRRANHGQPLDKPIEYLRSSEDEEG